MVFPILVSAQDQNDLLKSAIHLDTMEFKKPYDFLAVAWVDYRGSKRAFQGTVGNLEWVATNNWSLNIENLNEHLLNEYQKGYAVTKKFHKKVEPFLFDFSIDEIVAYERSKRFMSIVIPELEKINLSCQIGNNVDSLLYYQVEKGIDVHEFPIMEVPPEDENIFVSLMWVRGILLMVSQGPYLHIYSKEQFLKQYKQLNN